MTLQELNNIPAKNMRQYTFNFGIFDGGEVITQRFNDKEGLKYVGRVGHDGIDMIPKSGSWDVHAVEDGEVIYAGWDTKLLWGSSKYYRGYGIMTLVWNRDNNRVWIYAHLANNLGIKEGMQIKKGDKVGLMGGSGFGVASYWKKHLHLGVLQVNELAQVTNRNNGFWGALDPTPIIDNIRKNMFHLQSEDQLNNWLQNHGINRLRELGDGTIINLDNELARLREENNGLREQISVLTNNMSSLQARFDDLSNSLAANSQVESRSIAIASEPVIPPEPKVEKVNHVKMNGIDSIQNSINEVAQNTFNAIPELKKEFTKVKDNKYHVRTFVFFLLYVLTVMFKGNEDILQYVNFARDNVDVFLPLLQGASFSGLLVSLIGEIQTFISNRKKR